MNAQDRQGRAPQPPRIGGMTYVAAAGAPVNLAAGAEFEIPCSYVALR